MYWPDKASPDPEEYIKHKKIWRAHFEWYHGYIKTKNKELQETLISNANYIYLKYMYDTW